MIESTKLLEIEQGDSKTVLFKRIIMSPPCDANSERSRDYFNEIIRLMSTNSDIYRCGPVPPEEMSARHDGERWVFTFKCLYEKTN